MSDLAAAAAAAGCPEGAAAAAATAAAAAAVANGEDSMMQCDAGEQSAWLTPHYAVCSNQAATRHYQPLSSPLVPPGSFSPGSKGRVHHRDNPHELPSVDDLEVAALAAAAAMQAMAELQQDEHDSSSDEVGLPRGHSRRLGAAQQQHQQQQQQQREQQREWEQQRQREPS